MAARRSSISDEIAGYIHTNSVNLKDRTIYCHPSDEDGWELDPKQALTFIENLDYLNSLSSEPITIKMFCPGGDYYSGMLIHDSLKFSVAKTTVISYGIAASMGSIVPQAATYRYISPNTSFMIHRLSYSNEGDILLLKSGIGFADKQMELMYNIYADRCVNGQFFKEHKMNKDKVKTFIMGKLEKVQDWWMTAEEAVYYGFMDGIYDGI